MFKLGVSSTNFLPVWRCLDVSYHITHSPLLADPYRRTPSMILHDLLEQLIATRVLKPSRHGPMRTAVKQYAAILGRDPTACPPEVYHLRHDRDNDRVGALIEAKASAQIGPDARRNLKNNIRFLLRRAVDLNLISPLPPPPEPLASFHKRSRVPRHGVVQGAYVPRERHELRPLPPPLAREYEAFYAWSTQPYAPDRPAHLKKRAVTMANCRLISPGVPALARASAKQFDLRKVRVHAFYELVERRRLGGMFAARRVNDGRNAALCRRRG
jgi:hypothetical protein